MENKEYVYVVTNPENGWDCVIGVFKEIESIYKYLEIPIKEDEKKKKKEDDWGFPLNDGDKNHATYQVFKEDIK